MTRKITQKQVSFNPLAYGELPQQKPVHPKDAIKIFAKRKVPENILAIKETDGKKSLFSDYPNGGTSIPEQARALRNNVDLIYQFVHDNIEFLPNYGLHKGGLGALVDGSGNAFDQSDLMVRLLTEAGYTAKYVIGYITLSATQWSNWLGVNSSAIAEAVQLLANGGISAVGNSTTNQITLGHCWVKVTIDSVDYAFDPAFKIYDYTSSIVGLATAMGYDRSTFLSRAEAGSTFNADYAKDLNDANINADLTTFSMNLVDWIKNNNSGATLDQILSGKRIQPTTGTLRQTDLSYHNTGLSTITSNVMPDNLKATFRFQYDLNTTTTPNTYRIDVAFYTADMYGKRATLWFDGSRVARFYLDGTQYGNASAAQGAGTETNAVFSVEHPYAGTFADTVQTSPIKAGAQTTIGASFGWGSKHLAAAHQELQNSLIAAGAATSSEPMLGTSLLLIWDNYVGQCSNGADLVCRISNTNQILHHFVGTVSQLPTGSGSLKVISSFLAAFSTSALTAGGDITATAFTNSLFFQALEGAVNRQVTGIEAADIASVIRKVNQLGIKVYDANSSNWTTGANVSSLMSTAGYPAAEITKIGNTFITPGWRVAMPETAAVPIGSFSNFYAYMGISPNNRSLLSQTWFGAKGAVAAGYQSDADTNSAASDNARQVNGFGMPAATATESARVNLLNGRYEYSSQDLSVGNQGAPYELSFVRSYNSALRLTFQGMGFGWSHNWLMKSFENSDGYVSLGDQQVSAAAAAIAALFVTRDVALSDSNVPIKNVVIASIVQAFLSSQMSNNVVRVQDGAGVQVFAKMPDGSYLPGIGMHGTCTLTKSGSPAFFTFTTADKVVHTYRSTGEISSIAYPFGITISFTYNSSTGTLTKVSNGFRDLNFVYDTFNQLKSINDGNGRTVTFTINSTTGNLTAVEDPMLKTTTYAYDQRGRMTQVFKPAFPSTPVITNTYDTLSRVKQQTDAFGNLWQFFIAGNRSEEVAPNSESRIVFFNARGNTVKEVNALGDAITYSFDGLERNTNLSLPEGNSSSNTFDWMGNVLSTTLHAKPGFGLADRTSSFTYDLVWASKVKTSTDAAGHVTTNTYAAVGTNGAGKIVKVEQPTVSAGTPTSLTSYNTKGQVVSQTDATGRNLVHTYESVKNNLISTTLDPSGFSAITQFGYDAVGNVTSVTDPVGKITSAIFDNMRRATQTTEPAPTSQISIQVFDDNGNVTQTQSLVSTDPNVQVCNYTYAVDGKLLSANGPLNVGEGSQPIPETYEYDSLRRLSRVTDGQGTVQTTFYDSLSRPFKTDINGDVQVQTTFTQNGRTATVLDERGKLTTFVYDGFDRCIRKTYPDATFESVTYDVLDNAITTTTRAGIITTISYDELNRAVQYAPAGQPVKTIVFDLGGRTLSVATPVIPGDLSTGSFGREYDTLGRMFKETYPDGKAITATMDKNGNVLTLLYPDGTGVTNTFDTLDRLKTISGFGGNVAFDYDSASNLISTIYGNSTGKGKVYDKVSNTLAITFAGLKPNAIETAPKVGMTFGSSDVSQRNSKKVSDTSLNWEPGSMSTTTYGAANDLNQYPVIGGTTVTYNPNGCMTSDGVNTYSYDYDNKLIGVTTPTGSIVYKYDPLGRLALKTVGSSTIRYLYSGFDRIEEYDASGSLLRRYVHGAAADECLYSIDAISGQIAYLHSDETNSTVLATNSVGEVTNKNVYSPWGELKSGSLGTIPVGFTGQFFDQDVGLYYFKTRHYSPKLGRFLQPDGIGYAGGMNLYEFCQSDPINLTDPFGTQASTVQLQGYAYYGQYQEPIQPRTYFSLPNYLSQNAAYLRPNIGYGSGGMSGGNFAQLLFMLAYFSIVRQIQAAQAAAFARVQTAAVQAVNAMPPIPPKYLQEAVSFTRAIADSYDFGLFGYTKKQKVNENSASFVAGTIAGELMPHSVRYMGPKKIYVYRYIDLATGEVLKIGKTSNLWLRKYGNYYLLKRRVDELGPLITGKVRDYACVPIAEFATGKEAQAFERETIKIIERTIGSKPRGNIQYN